MTDYMLKRDKLTILFDDLTVREFNAGDSGFQTLRSFVATTPSFSDEEFRAVLDKTVFIFDGATLKSLSSRLDYDSVNDVLYFDGDVVHTAIGDYVRQLAREESHMLPSFVKFMERVYANPEPKSREDLFRWITALQGGGEKMTIDPEGYILGYKGVKGETGNLVSINAGPGVVDGQAFTHAHLSNNPGQTVSIPRSYVDPDNQNYCSRGLHVGTFSYAHGFAQTHTLLVKVDPQDVVSVPPDCKGQKMRVCRYVVIEETKVSRPENVYIWDADWWDEDQVIAFEDKYGMSSESYRQGGYSYDQACDIQENGGLVAALDMIESEGFTTFEATLLLRNGVSLDDIVNVNFDPSLLEEDEEDDYEDDDYEDDDYEEDDYEEDDYEDEPLNVAWSLPMPVIPAAEALARLGNSDKKKGKKKDKKKGKKKGKKSGE